MSNVIDIILDTQRTQQSTIGKINKSITNLTIAVGIQAVTIIVLVVILL